MSDSKPISEKRLTANRENAKKSTGPRTEDGKARASRNADEAHRPLLGPAVVRDQKIAHGFRASSFAVVRLEDLDEVEKLKADAVACYKPVNSQELVAVERIAMAQQQIFRGARLDAGMFTSAMNEVLDRTNNPVTPMDPTMVGDGDIEITRQQNRNYCIAEGFRRIAKESNAIGLMLRYRAQAEREYRRAVEDFDRLKALRHQMPNEPNVGIDSEDEEIVPIEELNWELPHIRIEQQKKANRPVPNEPTVRAPNEPAPAQPNEPTATAPSEANTAVPNKPNVSETASSQATPAVPNEPNVPASSTPDFFDS
jgi:hypothetical protein